MNRTVKEIIRLHKSGYTNHRIAEALNVEHGLVRDTINKLYDQKAQVGQHKDLAKNTANYRTASTRKAKNRG